MTEQYIVIAEISGVFGVHGWIKLFSFTQQRASIKAYTDWQLRTPKGELKCCDVAQIKVQPNRAVLAKLNGIDTPEKARELIGALIEVPMSQLPSLEAGEYYWHQLIGMQVENSRGVFLGEVIDMLETGANDVLIVQCEGKRYLIPFKRPEIVIAIEPSRIIVNWEEDWDAL